ncbi:acyl-CoA thioesterase [Streptomyces sp. AJS327]|uniref:acyl-CoA thioesterase n=1 Tax=Streptomyces sp. AJS327 TaxID=2545265 RepID=UPI0015DFE983|nr:acyl-CoA thioesterase [Streptomyces sp. AJS327]MBA0054227.1 acyl-CoA thioesterase [Streptomyces sp. AJS327]
MEPFSVRITVRGYETDAQGHLNQSVYLQYAEHARWTMLERAGIRQQDMLKAGVGPVALENTVRYQRELRAGDEVDIRCGFAWGTGRSFRVEQVFWRPDGIQAAEVHGVVAVFDLAERQLVTDPRAALRELATEPDVLGL